MDRGSPAISRRWSSRCPRPASSRTTALLSRLVTSAPAGPGVFPGTRPSPQIGDLSGELLLARRLGSRPGSRAFRPALGPRPERLRASRPVLAAPAFQRRDARDRVLRHDLRLGHAVLDVVARGRDLRLPVVASAAVASHDRLLAVGLVQPDPVSRGIHRYGKPSGERVPAGSGLDEFQRLAPEPVVVTSPSILTHTKEPHLRSSNLNFFSPTIGVRFRIVVPAFHIDDASHRKPCVRRAVSTDDLTQDPVESLLDGQTEVLQCFDRSLLCGIEDVGDLGGTVRGLRSLFLHRAINGREARDIGKVS